MDRLPVYLEVGRRRVFVSALDWPGWSRSGPHEDAALETLVAYGPRYAIALGRAARFAPPSDPSALQVVERLEGNATTDFGAPGRGPSQDDQLADEEEVRRLARVLMAFWDTFDRTAQMASGAFLRKGPRGGGRDLDAIMGHVLDAEKSYLLQLGVKYRNPPGADTREVMAGVRHAILEALPARARGELPALGPRSGRRWTPRYFVRRAAWHVLDHAWEIEDRARP